MVETGTTPTTPVGNKAGDDQNIGEGESGALTVIKAVREYKNEAQQARRFRLKRNRENRLAYLGIQDWSHKNKGQSKEFLPKVPVAVEQFVGFAKRALTQFGSYYEIELGKDSQSPLSGGQIRSLLNCHLDNLLTEDNVTSTFPTLVSDGLKVGCLESLCIFKVHGNMINSRKFVLEPGQQVISPEGVVEQDDATLKPVDVKNWRLRIDLLQPEQYYPDPTGQGLYEIHSAEKDLHYVKKRAEEGIYNKEAVRRIEEDFTTKEDQHRRPIDKNQNETQKPSFRKKVRIDEFWGTIVDAKGNVVHENIFCAIANDKYLIRKPAPNPFWHQESPFVAVPLIRVPFSVWHKALFDHASQINFAQNELFNLIIDGGIASVWGIKQLRVDDLEDPRQVADGIKQGDTLQVKSTLPHGAKVLETASEGAVPPDSMAVLEMLSREFAASALSNELKLGNLPGNDIKATAVVEMSQSQAVTLDGIIGDIERFLIGRTLNKAWLNMLQNMDDVSSDEVIDAIGIKAAFILSRMSPAERFATFAGQCSFKVNGLSAVLAKVRDFQKMMALLQSVITNPILMQAFFMKYSPDRVLAHLMKTLSVNPEQMERDEEEMARMQGDLQNLPIFQQLTGTANTGGEGGGGGAGLSAQQVGEPGLPAEINAVSNPTSGLAGVGES